LHKNNNSKTVENVFFLSYVSDNGEKLETHLKERLKKTPDELFDFLFDKESDGYVYYSYYVEKIKKNKSN
jgi:hypothetical protein